MLFLAAASQCHVTQLTIPATPTMDVFAYIPLFKNYFHSFPLIFKKGLKSHLFQEVTSSNTFA